MKISGVLGVLFTLFVLIHGQENFRITCTESWLQVQLRRLPIVPNLQVQPNELYLGTGCPVNLIDHNFFEFLYLVIYCGIRINEQPLGTIIESFITYEPAALDITYYIPVSCYVQRGFPILWALKTREYNRAAQRSLGQKC
ncbi:oocyte-secreted protein 4A-like [Tupaia chinensis]|uniref:oocyte-secreted protein 4A-like n=1 Tax=Tupaia chinensis TaxID=246437 RepID=UPI0003C91F77|nr:oocyte-secreted protein 4A-like [Tupaia chinensis]XP_006147476.1 oocyte-secreted protein 4A-like [Tupaia chinensis]